MSGRGRWTRVGGAALLCAASLTGVTLLRMLASYLALGPLLSLTLQSFTTFSCFLVPAVVGLLVINGDRTQTVRLRTLSMTQIRFFALAGALAVCPASLLADMIEAFARLCGAAQQTAAIAPEDRLFLPMVLQSVIFAPVCEELFFRGYLLGVFEERTDAVVAATATGLLFALAHGLGMEFPVYALLGILFAAMTLRADSLLAAIVAHGFYNATLLALAFTGLGRLLTGLTMASCALRLLGSCAFVVALKQALAQRPGRRRARIWDGRWFNRRETLLLLFAAIALIASQVVAALLGPLPAGE